MFIHSAPSDVDITQRGKGDTFIENMECKKVDLQNFDNTIQMRNVKVRVFFFL